MKIHNKTSLRETSLCYSLRGRRKKGRGEGKAIPLPFSLSPYPLPLSTPATQATLLQKSRLEITIVMCEQKPYPV